VGHPSVRFRHVVEPHHVERLARRALDAAVFPRFTDSTPSCASTLE
jgi:hypothetical protein